MGRKRKLALTIGTTSTASASLADSSVKDVTAARPSAVASGSASSTVASTSNVTPINALRKKTHGQARMKGKMHESQDVNQVSGTEGGDHWEGNALYQKGVEQKMPVRIERRTPLSESNRPVTREEHDELQARIAQLQDELAQVQERIQNMERVMQLMALKVGFPVPFLNQDRQHPPDNVS